MASRTGRKLPKVATSKPCCFISYSSREPHVGVLVECARMVFGRHYNVILTPSGIMSGASQREQITALIRECSFGIVSLDGLRANVSFEYGILHALGKPVILLREENAQVDILSFFRDSPDLLFNPVSVDLDSQFSDVKDVNYATWSRYSFSRTSKVLWDEFYKKKPMIQPFFKVPEPTW